MTMGTTWSCIDRDSVLDKDCAGLISQVMAAPGDMLLRGKSSSPGRRSSLPTGAAS
jgi:hypothetical protein